MVRDGGLSAAVSAPANAPVSSSRLDSSRAASTSHLDAVQLRQPPTVDVQHQHSESAIGRLAPGGTAQPTGAAARQGSDQRVMEWQMRNQMVATGTDSPGQAPRRFDIEPNPGLVGAGQKPSYYPARPQSQLAEPGYVVPAPAKTVPVLPPSTSMPASASSVVGSRGQMSTSSGLPSFVSAGAVASSVSTPVYSDDQRYRPQHQLQTSMYDQQPSMSASPQFNQVANVRPQMVRQPLPGMATQDVYQPGPNRLSNLPDVYQQPPVFGKSAQYGPSSDVAVGSEQKPSYYPARPQSQFVEPGYVMPAPAKTAAPLPQGNASMPVTTDVVVGNRGQVSASSGPQSSSEPMLSDPAYSDDQRYRLQQDLQTSMYDQQPVMSAAPQFAQLANVRPQMPQMVRQPLPGMAPQDIQYLGPNVRSNLPGVPQPLASGAEYQYRPASGQYGVHGGTSMTGMTAPGVQYVSGMPAVSSADGMPVQSVTPDIYDRRPALQQGVQHETADVERRAVPAGVPFITDNRPHPAHEAPPYTERPRPADVRYGMQNVAGAVRPVSPNPQTGVRYGMPNVGGPMPPAPPGVHYGSSVGDNRLAGAVPAGARETSMDPASVKLSQQGSHYESASTAASYGSQEAPYRIYSTSGSTSVERYEADRRSNTGDSWPMPPQSDHHGALSVQNVPPSATVPPPTSRVPGLQYHSTGDGSRPLPSEPRPRMHNAATPVPSLGMPTNDVRPKRLPPPVAAKPRLPVSTGVAMKAAEIMRDEGRQLKPEKMQQKMLEIQRLESRPYLTANEQTRLRNLRVEVEFDRRLADLSERREDSGDPVEQSRMFPPMVRFLPTSSRKISVCLTILVSFFFF